MSNKSRNANLELLRIICMYMIVFAHCIGHGGLIEAQELSVINYQIFLLLKGFIAVLTNCFVLISGYFLSQSEFKIKKWLELWTTVVFWAVVLTIICMVSGAVPFRTVEIIKAIMPFSQEEYWFVTTYLLMYLLIPLLNTAIQNFSQRQFCFFLIVFFAVYIVLQNIIFWREFTHLAWYDSLFFAFLYMVAGYIRRFPPKKKRHYFLWYIIFCLGGRLLELIVNVVLGDFARSLNVRAYNAALVVLASICLFMCFLSVDIKNDLFTKMITMISPLTFGIYLIHDNNHVRELLWKTLFDCEYLAANPFVVPIAMGISLLVFMVCLPMEYIRKKLFVVLKISKVCEMGEKVLNYIINWIAEKWFFVK